MLLPHAAATSLADSASSGCLSPTGAAAPEPPAAAAVAAAAASRRASHDRSQAVRSGGRWACRRQGISLHHIDVDVDVVALRTSPYELSIKDVFSRVNINAPKAIPMRKNYTAFMSDIYNCIALFSVICCFVNEKLKKEHLRSMRTGFGMP